MEMFLGFMCIILGPLFFCAISTYLLACSMFFKSTFVAQSASFWFFKTFLLTLVICFVCIALAMSTIPEALIIVVTFLTPIFRFMRVVN